MTWFAIEPKDTHGAEQFARDTVSQTYDRMGYGNKRTAKKTRRDRISIGKVAEQVVFRYLREELNLHIIESTNGGGPDQYDFIIEHEGAQFTGDVKSFDVYRTYKGKTRTPETIERKCSALVPVDQYQNQPKDLYVFAVILSDRNMLKKGVGSCFIRWATHSDIGSWNRIPTGTVIYPYDRTRNHNYGRRISECRAIEELHTYLQNP